MNISIIMIVDINYEKNMFVFYTNTFFIYMFIIL